MSQQLMKGDLVWVHDDEGLDVPTEAQGLIGRVIGYVREATEERKIVEYIVQMPDGTRFNAAFYHVVRLPKIRMYDNPKNLMGILHTSDPDLHERVREISTSHYRLRDFSDATAVFALLWLGIHEITDNPRCLEGSGIHEVV